MTKTAAVFLATGTEEMEFTIIYDVLVRAGVKVTSVFVPSQDEQASPKDGYVVASRGVKLVPDTTLDACLQGAGLQSFDALIVPGGAGGASTMSQHAKLREALKAGEQQGQLLGLICAGPLAALESQVGLGGPITSHPSVKEKLSSSYQYEEKPVVTGTSCLLTQSTTS